MSQGDAAGGALPPAAAAGEAADIAVFVSYRRADTVWVAQTLDRALCERFGADNVFFDLRSLVPGDDWLGKIRARGRASDVVFLALIGSRWGEILHERGADSEGDIVRLELAEALRHRARVLPVLVDGASPPAPELLDRALRPLVQAHAAQLRHDTWSADVTELLRAIEELARAPVQQAEPPPVSDRPPGPSPAEPRETATTMVPGPAPDHYAEVARCLVNETGLGEPVVIFVGSGVNGSDSGATAWTPEAVDRLPDAHELAAHLGRVFGVEQGPRDLAQIAQFIAARDGDNAVDRLVRKILGADVTPTSVHAFLADLPGRLERLGYPERFQLLVTSNYDTALERAFDAAGTPYDLAVYVASGPGQGKFLHSPHAGAPELVDDPQGYRGFPIHPTDELPLKRTLIVKVHGDVTRRPEAGGEGYVLTEDQYIDYLVGHNIPKQLVAQIKGSPCLYLGHPLHDWNLRVFLHRVWEGQTQARTQAWAIERDPDEFELSVLKRIGIALYAMPLSDYVVELAASLDRHATAVAGA
jgi:hypothetical protein